MVFSQWREMWRPLVSVFNALKLRCKCFIQQKDTVFSWSVRMRRSHVGETLSMFIKPCLLVGNLFKNKTRNPFEVSATGSFTIKINPYCAPPLLLFLTLSWVYNQYLFFTTQITRPRNLFQMCSWNTPKNSDTAFVKGYFWTQLGSPAAVECKLKIRSH